MPHHLRYQSSEWALHHVVSRCINGFSFLKPTPPIVQICTGVLGRALAMYAKRIRLIHMVRQASDQSSELRDHVRTGDHEEVVNRLAHEWTMLMGFKRKLTPLKSSQNR